VDCGHPIRSGKKVLRGSCPKLTSLTDLSRPSQSTPLAEFYNRFRMIGDEEFESLRYNFLVHTNKENETQNKAYPPWPCPKSHFELEFAGNWTVPVPSVVGARVKRKKWRHGYDMQHYLDLDVCVSDIQLINSSMYS